MSIVNKITTKFYVAGSYPLKVKILRKGGLVKEFEDFVDFVDTQKIIVIASTDTYDLVYIYHIEALKNCCSDLDIYECISSFP
jgi:hypothetical protein